MKGRKKLFAILLAAVLLIAMAVPALAGNPGGGSERVYVRADFEEDITLSGMQQTGILDIASILFVTRVVSLVLIAGVVAALYIIEKKRSV